MRWALTLGLLVTGCASQQGYMRPAAGPAPACDADAYVVFVRPSAGGSTIEVREADGTFLGQLDGRSYFGTAVSPGPHFFVAETGRTDSRPAAIKAELGAGLTYYVDVELVKGFAVLYAVAPRMPYWKDLPGWLANSQRVQLDPAKGRAPVPEDWLNTYSYAFNWFGGLDEQNLAQRKLIVSDGTTEGAPAPLASLSADNCADRPAKPGQPVALATVTPKDDRDLPNCTYEKQTGSNFRKRVCRTGRQADDERESARQFLDTPHITNSAGH